MPSFLQLFVAVSVVGAVAFFYKYCFQLWRKIHYYKSQGVTIMPGAWRPFIGNLPEIAKYDEFRGEDEPLPMILQWIMKYWIDQDDRTSLKYENHKAVAVNLFGDLILLINDKDIAQDLFNKKNKLYDKTGQLQQMFEELIPSAFVFSPSNEDWRQKRKAAAHLFAKERLNKMIEMLKDQLMVRIDQWLQQIKESSEGKTVIDINSVFSEILTQNILTINFGFDISDTIVDFDMREFTSSTDFVFKRKKVKIGVALTEIVEQVLSGAAFKHLNSFYQLARKITGKKDFTDFQRTITNNQRRVRGVISDIFFKRKSGHFKSMLEDGADILTLLLENQDVYNDDAIIDELIDFFGAATQTTNSGIQTMVSILAQRQDVLQKIRIQFKEHCGNKKKQTGDKKKSDVLKEIVNLQFMHDLEYCNYVMMETLRMQGPIAFTTISILTRTAKCGDIVIQKGDEFFVHLQGLAKNADEWPNPHEFIPERFDSSHEASKTKSCLKRVPASMSVFSGGSRKCFGKTLAESTMLMFMTYLTQNFNFEFVDKKFEMQIPMASFGMSKQRPVEVILTKHKD